jgi:ribonuclease BN (tRNA processing enzyme)
MKIIFLGTSGWYDNDTGNTPSILIQANDFHVVLDAGNGIYKLDQYIKDEKTIYVFITHLHLDHIEGFHTFDKFEFKQKINIYVPNGCKELLNSIIRHPFTAPFSSIKTPCEVTEIMQEKNDSPFGFEAIKLDHEDGDTGYRLNIDGKIISYSGDSIVCENSKKLANDADLLIHECSFTEDVQSKWGHSKPTEVASLAKETGVKRLALTHFDPTRYLNIELRKEAEKIAKSIFTNTVVANDGLEIII